MEILLNCAWLFLGLTLIVVWSAHAWRTRGSHSDGLLPPRRLQFTALLVLVLLLLPVISLTDDISLFTASRDAERALRLHDPIDGSHPAQAFLPVTMAWMDTVAAILRNGPSRPVEQDAVSTIQLVASQFPIDSRPPPAAL